MAILEARETYDLHPDDAWQRLKMRLRKPQELAVLKYVAAWREREARARNVPRARVVKDDAIYEIAQQQPKDSEALARLRTIPKGWERSAAGAAVIEAINAALALPQIRNAASASSSAGSGRHGCRCRAAEGTAEADCGKAWRRAESYRNSEDLDKIAAEGEKADVAALTGWRRDLFGETALQLIQGQVALRFVGKRVETVTL